MASPSPALRASQQSVDTLFARDYWAKLCPELHVSDAGFQRACQAANGGFSSAGKERGTGHEAKSRMVDEGFATIEPEDLQWSVDRAAVVRGIVTLREHGWPATAIIVYDEAWAMAVDAARVMKEVVPHNRPVTDTLCFFVDPSDASRGFSAHRDRQPEDWMAKGFPEDARSTFWPDDGTARYATLWIALTDATPDNSCLHYIPAEADEGYYGNDNDGECGVDEDQGQQNSDKGKEGKEGEEGKEGKGGGAGALNPVQSIMVKSTSAIQVVRAAPVRAGGCALHTHRVIHWGSKGRASYRGAPRVALSFAFSDPAFEAANFVDPSADFPAHEQRVALMCGQVINYSSLSATDSGGWLAVMTASGAAAGATFLRTLHQAFRRQAAKFHATYRSEITAKFLALSTESNVASAATSAVEPLAAAAAAAAATAGKRDRETASDTKKGTEGAAAATDGDKSRAGTHTQGGSGSGGGGAHDDDDDNDDDDDAVDEALEAMLQDELESGKATYHDDFDAMNQGECPEEGGGFDGEDEDDGEEDGEDEDEDEGEEECDDATFAKAIGGGAKRQRTRRSA